MNRKIFALAVGLLIASPMSALGQNPVIGSLGGLHGITQQAITATADMLSEDLYSFRPTDEVRTVGQLLGHIATANYGICSAAAGESNPISENLEQTKTTKSEIVAALAESFDYCSGVYEAMTDEKGAEMTPFFGGQDMARSAILAFNSAHNYEHYGNLVTYMRINGITPPTSS